MLIDNVTTLCKITNSVLAFELTFVKKTNGN